MKTIENNKAFLGLSDEQAASYQNAKCVIIPFGLEKTVTFGKGTTNGPKAILAASHEVELFDEVLWCEPYEKIGIVTLESPTIADTSEAAVKQLADLVSEVVDADKFALTLGGEHTLTAGAIAPYLAKHPDLVILHFDAHADLRDGYNGEYFSHAAALKCCLDQKPIPLISLGIRNISKGEAEYYEANKDHIHIYWGKDQANWDIDEILSHLKDRPIYLTFDVDAFDSSLMPATGTPEPGGLHWNFVMDIILKASQTGKIVGADVNELAPKPDLHGCDFLVAKLVYKIISYAFLGKAAR